MNVTLLRLHSGRVPRSMLRKSMPVPDACQRIHKSNFFIRGERMMLPNKAFSTRLERTCDAGGSRPGALRDACNRLPRFEIEGRPMRSHNSVRVSIGAPARQG